MKNEINILPKDGHKYYLDFLRVFACLFVVYIHISGNFNNDILSLNSKTYFITQIFRSIALTAVPLFVMISGSVNLGKPITKEKLRPKIFNLLRLYIIWSLISVPILISLNSGIGFSLTSIKFIIENIPLYFYQLWYLPMLIGLYLLIPILNKIILSKKILKYLLKLYFILLIILTLCDVLNCFGILKLGIYFADIRLIFPVFVGYFLLGYYIDHYNIKLKTKEVIVTVSLLIISILIISILLPIITNRAVIFDYRNSIIYFILVPFIFLFAKERLNINSKIISNISKNSLGIYLVHIIFVNLFYFNVLKYLPIHPLILIPISSIVIFILCYFTVTMLKKIPLIRKCLG